MYIEKINSPADVKKLNVAEMTQLSQEIRTALLQKLSHHGGHVGPNLGMVEATIALHYVFNSPTDQFVFDVSHQSYTHKMLTGRREAFLQSDHYDDVSGYTCPGESEHDFFTIGHTSTSVSLACGLAKARDLKGEKYNVIAIIGDGSLSGGEAYEGLNNVAEQGTNLIVIVNDNQMSIAENHGGLYRNLQALRESNGTCSCNFFKALGFDYKYVDNGNDLQALIDTFREVKDIDHPIVLHINTIKGKGYGPAVTEKERFHWSLPFDLETSQVTCASDGPDYTSLTNNYLMERMDSDPQFVVLTAGTPAVMGFDAELRMQAGKQFVDVGIAEEHAVAMSSALAKGGARPVFGVFSSFIQRTYDQLSQDLCINRNAAVLAIFAGSVCGMNDETHLGFFDIPLLCNIPNMVYLCPTSKEEYFGMMDWAIEQTDHPVAVRVPVGPIISRPLPAGTDFSQLGHAEVVRKGSRVALLGLGNFLTLALQTADLLKEKGIDATVINPRYASHYDEQLLNRLKADHEVVITLEDGTVDGGWGEKIARFYGDSAMKVRCYGADKAFADRYNLDEFLKAHHLTAPQIAADVAELC